MFALLVLLPGLATLSGARVTLPLHDLLGELTPASAPGAIVLTFDDAPAAAAAQARALGASSVWMALPADDPRLPVGVNADPGTLAAGADGRVRFDGGGRLPLPEALEAIPIVQASGTDARSGQFRTLGGFDVVLAWSDPVMGYREAAPWFDQPVDRARLLAVALEAARADSHLRVLAEPLAALVCAFAAAGSTLAIRRRRSAGAGVITGLLLALTVAGGLLARRHGVDLPIGGLLLGPVLAAVADADAVLGALKLVLPDASLSVWSEGNGGVPVLEREVPGAADMPPPAALPEHELEGRHWMLLPYMAADSRRMAVGVAVPERFAFGMRRFAAETVRGLHVQELMDVGVGAFEMRLGLVATAIRVAHRRVEGLEGMLSTLSDTSMVFDSLGRPFRTAEGGDLLTRVSDLSSEDEERVRRAVARALAGRHLVRLEGHSGSALALVPLLDAQRRYGVLLRVHRPDAFQPWRTPETIRLEPGPAAEAPASPAPRHREWVRAAH